MYKISPYTIFILFWLLRDSTYYHVLKTEINNKHFVVVIPSYNNKAWYKNNLDSVFSQDYTNYQVIYIDDCSSDGTGNLVEEYIKEKKQEHRVTLLKNTFRQRQLANHYTAVHMCQDTDIIVNLDGDDWFAHTHVLSYLNNVYRNPEVWLTYGQYMCYPSSKKGHCRPFPNIILEHYNFRAYKPWIASHLRSFYAGLFKHIKLADLLYQGKFFPVCADQAIMFPMLEMAGRKFKYIDEILYCYNCTSPINLYKIERHLQRLTEQVIRAKPKYPQLNTFIRAHKPYSQVNLIIFADDHPRPLFAFLESLRQYTASIRHIFIMCDNNSFEQSKEIYKKLHYSFPAVTLVKHHPSTNYKIHVLNFIKNISCDYIIVTAAHCSVPLTRPLNINQCIEELEKTHAYGFFLNNTYKSLKKFPVQPIYIELSPTVYARQFNNSSDTTLFFDLNMILFTKATALQQLKILTFTSSRELVKNFRHNIPSTQVGLFFKY